MIGQKLTASEALFGFAGWITSREEKVVASASHDASIWVELVDAFIKENRLEYPRDGWENNLMHPSGECSGKTEGQKKPSKRQKTHPKALRSRT